MNEKLAKGGFGLGDYEKWAVIAIIRPDNDPDYPEIKRVNKARKVIEFRLKVDHASFLNGTDRERISLLAKMLSRSLDQMAAPGVRQVEIDALKPLLQDFL